MTPLAAPFEIAGAEGRRHLGYLADGTPVFTMKGDDHLAAHPEMADLLPELFARVSFGDFEGRELDREFDLGYAVGVSRCVPTAGADEIVYARRKGRRAGWTRFVKRRETIPTSTAAIRFHLTDSGVVALLTAYIGHLTPPEPCSGVAGKNPPLRKQGQEFWAGYALVFDLAVIDESAGIHTDPFPEYWGQPVE